MLVDEKHLRQKVSWINKPIYYFERSIKSDQQVLIVNCSFNWISNHLVELYNPQNKLARMREEDSGELCPTQGLSEVLKADETFVSEYNLAFKF